MSARKLATTDLFDPVSVQSQTTRLDLASDAVKIRKNGIEFRCQQPIPVWTEMTVGLEKPSDPKKVTCTGVVVECNGNRHAGYMVSMVFTDVSRQAQARLNSLAYSRLA